MKSKICLWLMLLYAGVFQYTPVLGQSADSTWRNIENLKYTNAWLSSGHVLGLHALPVSKLAVAEVYGGKTKGGFVNYFESDNRYLAGAKVESFQKFNSKVAFQGKVAYETERGKNMGGSSFIDPYKYPLDLVEYSDSTAGDKKIERYNLTGGVTTKLGQRWKIGGKVDYEAANYSKFKDLRHTNRLLQLDANASVGYTVKDQLEVGLGYGYARRIESIKYKTYGNTDRQYLTLISFGSFYGMLELHDDKGYTSSQETNPQYDVRHNLSGLVHVKLGQNFQWFNAFTFGKRNGYFGKKGTSSIVYTEHEGSQLEYHGVGVLKQARSLHHFDVRLSNQSLENMQNIYRLETQPGATTTVVYYGKTKVLDQDMIQASFNYTGHFGNYGLTPRWILKTGVNYGSRTQQVSLYPFFRKQEINNYAILGSLGRNIVSGEGLFTLTAGTLFGSGGGNIKRDGLFATPSTSQSEPASRDAYLNREFEYLTASRMENTLGLRYWHKVTPVQQAYIQINYINTTAFEVSYLSKQRNTVQVALGYSF